MRPADIDWGANISFVISMLGECKTGAEAAEKLAAYFGKPVTKKTLHKAMLLHTGFGYGQFLDKNTDTGCSPRPTVPKSVTIDPGSGIGNVPHQEEHLAVVRAVQKGARTLEALCDRFGLPPRAMRQLVDSTRAAGHDLEYVDGGLDFRLPKQAAPEVVQKRSIKKTGLVFAAIADTHFGSEECAVKELGQFLSYAYDLGVRHVLHAGDIFDGCYHRGHHYELAQVGYDRQCRAALDALPTMDGLNYYVITGNHDLNSYWKAIGMDPGRGLQYRAEAAGRSDIHHIAATQGRLAFGDLKIELAHPQTGTAYARSYQPQKWVERYEGGDKPHICLIGHYHSYMVLEIRNVCVIQPGCWQYQTPYEQSKGLQPAVGGAIVWVERDSEGFRFRHEWRRWWPRGAQWRAIG